MKIIKTKKECEDILMSDDRITRALKALRKPAMAHARTRRGKKSVKRTTQVRESEELLRLTKKIVKYYRELTTLFSRKSKGKITLNHELTFIRRWAHIEDDYRKMMKMTCDTALTSPLINAAASNIPKNSEQFFVFSNPAFLEPKELGILKSIGLTNEEISQAYEYEILPDKRYILEDLEKGTHKKNLQAVRDTVDHIPFLLAPKYLAKDGVFKFGGDFFGVVLGFLSQVVAAVLTAVVVVAVAAVAVTAAVTAAVAASATASQVGNVVKRIAEPVINVVNRNLDWIDRQALHNDADRYDIKPNRFKIRNSHHVTIEPWLPKTGIEIPFKPECNNCKSPGPASLTMSTIKAVKVKIQAHQDTAIIAVIKDEEGCCRPGQTIEFKLSENGNMTERLIPMEGRYPGEYIQTFHAFDYNGLIPGEVEVTLFINDKEGPKVTVEIEPTQVGPSSFSPTEQMRLQARGQTSWQIDTSPKTANALASRYGYLLGNVSRSKRELHTPVCPFLYLVKPENLEQVESIEIGHKMGLDNCHYCLGESTR